MAVLVAVAGTAALQSEWSVVEPESVPAAVTVEAGVSVSTLSVVAAPFVAAVEADNEKRTNQLAWLFKDWLMNFSRFMIFQA
jgi:hypothetical protein